MLLRFRPLLAGLIFVLMVPITTASARPTAIGDSGARDCAAQVQIINRSALRPWWAALDSRETERADVLVIGDSISEGVGSDWENRLPVALQSLIRLRYPLTAEQGVGHVPAATWSSLRIPGLRTMGRRPSKVDSHGLGSKALALRHDSAVEFAFTGTQVRIWWGSTRRRDRGKVSIDGGRAVRLRDASRGSSPEQVWVSGVLESGLHQVRVTTESGSTPLLVEGFEVFGSESDLDAGVHVMDGTHGGWASHGWVPSLRPSARRHWQAASRISPDLTIIDLGVNDWYWHTPPVQVRSNLAAIAANAQAAADGPHAVLIVVPYRVVWGQAKWPPRQWRAIRRALLKMAGDNIAVLDLQRYWPRLLRGRGFETGLMLEDLYPVHPNTDGHRLIAETLTRALMPPGTCG